MKRKKYIVILIISSVLGMFALTGCKHYCSYGGCMKEVSEKGGRCSEHRNLENDPYYGLPDSWID